MNKAALMIIMLIPLWLPGGFVWAAPPSWESIVEICGADPNCAPALEAYIKALEELPPELRESLAQAETDWLHNGWGQAGQMYINGGFKPGQAYAQGLKERTGDLSLKIRLHQQNAQIQADRRQPQPSPKAEAAPPEEAKPRPGAEPPPLDNSFQTSPTQSIVPESPSRSAEEICLADSDCSRIMDDHIKLLLDFPPDLQLSVMKEELLWRANDWAAAALVKDPIGEMSAMACTLSLEARNAELLARIHDYNSRDRRPPQPAVQADQDSAVSESVPSRTVGQQPPREKNLPRRLLGWFYDWVGRAWQAVAGEPGSRPGWMNELAIALLIGFVGLSGYAWKEKEIIPLTGVGDFAGTAAVVFSPLWLAFLAEHPVLFFLALGLVLAGLAYLVFNTYKKNSRGWGWFLWALAAKIVFVTGGIILIVAFLLFLAAWSNKRKSRR